jgi:hypothetical protein
VNKGRVAGLSGSRGGRRGSVVGGLGLLGALVALAVGGVPAFAGLPDGRVWQLVSPPEKFGGRIEPITEEGGLTQSNEEGSALTYVANAPLVEDPEGNPSLGVSQLIATRQPSGEWSGRNIATPHNEATGITPGHLAEYLAFSPSLSTAFVEPKGATALTAEATEKTPYLRDSVFSEVPSYMAIVTPLDTSTAEHFGFQVRFSGASPNLEHVVVNSAVPLLSGVSTEARYGAQLYEWGGGELEDVSVLPGGGPGFSPSLGSANGGYDVVGAVSTDGSRVFWSAGEGGSEEHLYMRDVPRHETIVVDKAQGVAEPAGGEAEFQGATPGGERVYFTDEEPLVPDAGPSSGAADLYEFEPESGHLSDLTLDSNGAERAEVEGHILGFSTEGSASRVYFVATGVLTSVPNAEAESAEPGENNLYVRTEEGGTSTTQFIARLAQADHADWGRRLSVLSELRGLTARVSSNGRYLAFMSQRKLTGYDNTDAVSGEPDEEVYLYDAGTSRLVCASCDPSGARPDGVLDEESAGEGLGLLVDRPKLWQGDWLAGSIPGWTAVDNGHAYTQSRYLENSGRLFFNSPDALVASDTNEKEDVYEYEPDGMGSCASATGCVGLLSAGTSSNESAFLEASESGNDVFILTTSSLVKRDTDSNFDIYDAQVCSSGAPCYTEPAVARVEPCASNAACRPALPTAPSTVLPATTSALGTGNESAPMAVAAPAPKRALTRAQELARALRLCSREPKRRRAACRARAQKRYGAPPPRKRGNARGKGHS